MGVSGGKKSSSLLFVIFKSVYCVKVYSAFIFTLYLRLEKPKTGTYLLTTSHYCSKFKVKKSEKGKKSLVASNSKNFC
jgi:hypothetical protein